MKGKWWVGGALFSVLVGSAGVARADSVLTFDIPGIDTHYEDIPGTYGDNLPDTPNVTVEYRTVTPSTGATFAPNLEFWTTGYGDRTNVAFAVQSGRLGEVFLVPDLGFSVTLQSFDLAGYFQSDKPNQTVRILDGTGLVVRQDYSPFNVEGNSGHSHFTPNITSANGLRIQFGPDWNTAIDNITFSQQVATAIPLPAAAWGGLGLLGTLGVLNLRKQTK